MNTEKTSTKPTMGALLLLCAAAALPVLSAAPSFGKSHHHGVTHYYSGHYYRGHGYRDYSGYLDPRSGHYDPEFQRNRENFGFSGRDPSYPGGEDPSLHPPGRF